MSLIENIAKLDRFARPIASLMPTKLYIDIYSRARREFLARLSSESPHYVDYRSWSKPIKLWDIDFNNNIFNAAGMFKSGMGYRMCALQGAGAWLAGTSTSLPRSGNRRNDILHPFLSLPRTKSALNWLGLPNDGHFVLADKISRIEKIHGCPIGVSVSSDPEEKSEIALKSLVEGMYLYVIAGVDFIELNESCPNVANHTSNSNSDGLDYEMTNRLEYISDKFLKVRKSNLPLIVKYSVDTAPEMLNKLIPMLISLGFDGINLGNTSTTYKDYISQINNKELDSFKYFTENFGGGVSGQLIKQKSLNLTKVASDIISSITLNKEFHIIRTGGIESKNDLKESNSVGASLNQWYTGYFDNFSNSGHKVYKNIIA